MKPPRRKTPRAVRQDRNAAGLVRRHRPGAAAWSRDTADAAAAALLPPGAEPGQLPDAETLRRFIAQSPGPVGKRDVLRAFSLGSEHRAEVRAMLRALGQSGDLVPASGRRLAAPEAAGDARVVQVSGTDTEGDALGRIVGWQGGGAPPVVFLQPEARGSLALLPGQRVLARLRPLGPGRFEGRVLKRLETGTIRLLGLFRPPPAGDHRGRTTHARGEAGRLVPTDRRQKAEWSVPEGETADAEPDEIVLAEPLPSRGYGLRQARVVERLGHMGDARSVSLICLYTHDIPQEFPAEVIAAADAAGPASLAGRTDLRAVPLVTIDGEDARDFDDAVFAEPREGGWRLLVAIADVAHYVRSGSPLDREAYRRGNSVYFPDRVVPMLPEALSNGWCSLKPGEPRGCLFVEMDIDASGTLQGWRFGRGLMRSAARLTYEALQRAQDEDLPLDGLAVEQRLALYGAFSALTQARSRRGTLDLDLPERRIELDEQGRVQAITPRSRLDSHRLIEEFMVLANVAAARELQRLRLPCMFRLHAPPSPEKLEALRAALSTLAPELSPALKPAGELRAADLQALLDRVRGHPASAQLNELVLRSQSQAEYGPDNIGHFGLALAAYAHFTSPIRRYADLLVHRALITGLRLGSDGLDPAEGAAFAERGEHITQTERRAALAERDAVDRYISAYMADKVGARFAARISGVTRFGLFVTLTQTGASGLVPTSALPDDFWMLDETTHVLTGRRSHVSWHLAQEVTVRLVEATPITGGLLFAMIGPADPSGRTTRREAGKGGRADAAQARAGRADAARGRTTTLPP